MTTPNPPRTMDSIVQNLIDRVRVLEALPALDAVPPYIPSVQLFVGLQMAYAQTDNQVWVYPDSTVINGGFTRIHQTWVSADEQYLVIPVWIGKPDGVYGPDASGDTDRQYMGHFVVREGPDTPIWDLQIASALVGGVIRQPTYASLTWVDIFTNRDNYNATDDWGTTGAPAHYEPNPVGLSTANPYYFYIILTGELGDVATAYAGATNGGLDGGPGMYYFAFRRTGKNASSSDYLFDIAEFGIHGITH